MKSSAPAAILNVGLDTRDGARPITVAAVCEALRAIGRAIVTVEVRESNTEPTAVVVIDYALSRAKLAALSVVLRQDCIAQLDTYGNGILAGPKADAWGPFNPDFFLMPEPAHV